MKYISINDDLNLEDTKRAISQVNRANLLFLIYCIAYCAVPFIYFLIVNIMNFTDIEDGFTTLFISIIIVNLIIILITFSFVVYFDKEKLQYIGLTIKNLFKSLLLGLVGTSIFLLLSYLITGEMYFDMSTGGFFYISPFLASAISSELVFRGYIQTRLSIIMKWKFLIIIFSGILFIFTKIPLIMILRLDAQLVIIYAFSNFLIHIFNSIVLDKTKCIYGPIILNFVFSFTIFFTFWFRNL
ncbi:type II CAAX prenyl endopeptidase Rce1 family protein [Miniphocaeibacter massiliensis]|uniref:CPBP family glutamic-type intramembrane protease n=1 Tax=Miniphocaeibacter massiliensis TaxID=2041841 RepID=UPI000C081E5E|nr:CPBP family glutamic-type intramembrane protease [Miniphocaeibacter massiliensis]